MAPSLYADHQLFMDNVRKLVDQELAPHVDAWEKGGHYPDDVFRVLGREGYLGILISEEFGGIGGDYLMAGAWCEVFGELRSVGLSIGVNMHSLVISHALEKYGSPESKKRWLAKATAGEAIGAYAFTEPGAGSDLARIRTRATRSDGKWVINGSKTFITNGERADFMLVLTKTDPDKGYKGFTTFLVDTSLPGFKVNRTLDKLGWRSSDTAELTFENVEVDDSCVLGTVGEGWIQAVKNLNWERLMLTLSTLGGMRACFRDALRYARQRIAFGKAIVEMAPIEQMLIEMQQQIALGEAISHTALLKLHRGEECRNEVAAAKRLVCEDAIKLADRAIQIHGGYGYTTEFSPERWWRDLRLMTIGGGTSEIMSNIVARELNLWVPG